MTKNKDNASILECVNESSTPAMGHDDFKTLYQTNS